MRDQETSNKWDGSESRPYLGCEAADAARTDPTSWRTVYLVVLGTLLFWIALLTVLTRAFS
jgi:hypothetical protein